MSATPWGVSVAAGEVAGSSIARAGRAISRVLAAPTLVVLGCLVAVSAVVRFVLALTSSAPWIIPDELIYSELARSFAGSGHFMVRDVPFSAWTYGPLYPVLIAPAYLFGTSAAHAYLIAKAINSILMSLAALPAYFLARRFVRRESAILVALLSVLVPSAIYTSKIMTESAAYPAFLLAVLAALRLLEKETVGRQVAVVGAVGLAIGTRAEMVVLIPALFTAIIVLTCLDARSAGKPLFSRCSLAEVLSFRVIWLATVVGAVGAVSVILARGGSVTGLLGAHEVLLHRVRLHLIPAWLAYQAADLDLYVGVIPFAAFLIVVVRAFRDGNASRPLRSFAALAVAAASWMILLAALYGTQRRPSPHVFDRYVFYVVPLFLIALLYWIEQGLPRPARLTWGAALLAGLLPVVLPLSTLLNGREWGTSSSSVGLLPWVIVGWFVGHGIALKAIVVLFSASLATLVVRSTDPNGARLLRVVAWNALAIGVLAVFLSAAVAYRATTYGVGKSPGWIDATVGQSAEVVAIWPGFDRSGEKGAYGIWESEFFNRSVGRIYNLREALPDSMPSARVAAKDGRLVEAESVVRATYVLADARLGVQGQRLVRDVRSGLAVYRVDGPIRISR